ncbi:MAG: hypothetical protein IJ035_04280 [Oscillospiraceae bacterium]|nr:hypothetical protein [Oscillospiraceae bacterium]
MKNYSKKFLIKYPDNLGDGNGYSVKIYNDEKNAAILKSDGESFGFEVIAEITGNDFYSDEMIAKRDGRLLFLEIERRWLVKLPNCLDKYESHYIEQAYLEPANGFQGRIRRWDNKFIYTEKARTGSNMSRIENEREITETEYAELQQHTILNVIKKRRYIIPVGTLKFELDVFENAVETGYGIMEAELPEETAAVELPAFVEIVREVTEDSYYTNRNFASMEKIKLVK